MRATLLVPLLIGCACFVESLPTTSKQIDEDVELVQPKYGFGEQPIIDTGKFDGPSFTGPFDSLFGNMQGVINRMKAQMETLLKRFPSIRSGNPTDNFPTIEYPSLVPRLPGGIDDIDLGKGNSTSVTKVIDGHKVVINDTEYKKSDEFGESFFRFRVIDVQPEDATTEKDAEAVTSASRDTEPVEADSQENEIPKSKEIVKDGPEKLVEA